MLMEKAQLLRELANLKRILKAHEQSESQKECDQQDCTHPSNKTHVDRSRAVNKETNNTSKSMIFLNPGKLNAIQQQKKPSFPENSNKATNVNHFNKSSKVFINPNFGKSNCISPHESYSKVTAPKSILKPKESCLKPGLVTKISDCIKTYQELKAHKLQSHQLVTSKQPNNESSCKTERNKIYINPSFSKMPHTKNVSLDNSHLGKMSNNNSRSYNTKNEIFSKNSLRKSCASTCVLDNSSQNVVGVKRRKIYFNQHKLVSKPTNNDEISKSIDDPSQIVKVIFVNPKFENTTSNKLTDIYLEGTATPVMETLNSNKIAMNVAEDSHHHTNLVSGESSLSSNSSEISFRGGSLKEPLHQKVNPKCITKRKRSQSTSLVSLSATKLVRKRKSSTNFSAINDKCAKSQPLLLTKTKLVRNTSHSSISSNILTKIKRVASKTNLHSFTSDKLCNTRRSSFANSTTKLVSSVSKPTIVTKIKSRNGKSLKLIQKKLDTNVIPKTEKPVASSSSVLNLQKTALVAKIKSKNGKSLKLIRKNLEANKSTLEKQKLKNINAIQKQKYLLQLQAKRNALCIIQNKLRKNQFSKINVPSKTKLNQSNVNKYVYKNKNLKTKKLSTKTNRVNTNIYKLVRKNSTMLGNQSLQTDKSPHNKQVSIRSNSKTKWRLQNKVTKMKHYLIRKQLSIVNIGGVFYRCSRTSLTRNKSVSKLGPQNKIKDPILNIHGQKFKLENNGLTLKCLDKKTSRKRIDIGGITYISSSTGTTLIRTNYHTTRSILLQAKQKSIALLTRNRKKNNEPCLFFHRFGRCSGKERGTCVRLHDHKNVAVCKKFVQGMCSDSQCLLSHEISCHNMPTCQHYLAGHCGRDNCLYPHIKVSDSAPICLDFLKGYCPLGEQCCKRHQEICPSFEKGICARGKYCPYPHPKSKSNDKKLRGKLKYLKRKTQPPRDTEPVSSCSVRYFEDINLQNENKIELEESTSKSEDNNLPADEENSCPFRKRPKLGRLPSFIPLSCNNFTDDDIKQSIDQDRKPSNS